MQAENQVTLEEALAEGWEVETGESKDYRSTRVGLRNERKRGFQGLHDRRTGEPWMTNRAARRAALKEARRGS